MKKILFATDAVKVDTQCLKFACYLSRLTSSKLTGIFLENMELNMGIDAGPAKIAVGSSAGAGIRSLRDSYYEKNIRLFKDTCTSENIPFEVQRNNGVPLQELINESRYADLIVADITTTCSGQRENVPTRFIKEILAASECPVVTAPIGFEDIEEIVFTYDESRSSVFAIKQFTYLFPEMHNRKACILSVTAPGRTISSDRFKLKEWLQANYAITEMITLEDEHVSSRLLEYLLGKKKVFIVMGSFGRSRLSGIFNPSHATPVIKMVSQPVFIAHP